MSLIGKGKKIYFIMGGSLIWIAWNVCFELKKFSRHKKHYYINIWRLIFQLNHTCIKLEINGIDNYLSVSERDVWGPAFKWWAHLFIDSIDFN